MLPKTFTNLRKLQHLRGDSLFLKPQVLDACLNRHDLFNLYRFSGGIANLKALHTLGNVFVCRGNGKATVKKLGELTQLRKLEVKGINDKGSYELWSAIAGHSQLLSVSVESQLGDVLDGCLGKGLTPPIRLESLTLDGRLGKATEWIGKLQNLSKLVLEHSNLKQDDDAIQVLGFLPNLAVLRLKTCSFEGTKLHFQSSSFLNLVVLELYVLENLQLVQFKEGTMPRLELLNVGGCQELNAFSGLAALKSLKGIRLEGSYRTPVSETLKKEVERQAAEHN